MSVKVIAYVCTCFPCHYFNSLWFYISFSCLCSGKRWETLRSPTQRRQNVKAITRRRIIIIIIIKSILKGAAFLCCIDWFAHICPEASKRLQFYCWTISIEPTGVIFQLSNRLEVLTWFITLWRLKKRGFNDLETYGGRKTSSETNKNGFISLSRLILLFEMICQQTVPIIRVKTEVGLCFQPWEDCFINQLEKCQNVSNILDISLFITPDFNMTLCFVL